MKITVIYIDLQLCICNINVSVKVNPILPYKALVAQVALVLDLSCVKAKIMVISSNYEK